MDLDDIPFVDVLKVRVTGPHRLWVLFSDGAEGERDFAPLLGSGPMTRPLADPASFARVFIEMGALTWPNGYDLDPLALYAEMRSAGELHRAAAE
jgi:hypothetical protein